MNVGTHPLPSLGQSHPRGSGQVRDFSLHLPASSVSTAESREKSLRTDKILDELRKDSKFQSPRSMSAVKTSPYTDARFFIPSQLLELPTDVVQWQLHVQHRLQRPIEVVGLQKTIPSDAAKSTTTLPHRGRITGPVKFINKLLATWDLKPESACILLGFEPSDLNSINELLQGHTVLRGRDAKDRISHLFEIRKLLAALFQDETVENEWLREPQDVLKGKTPMALLLEGSMENLLLVREYVELVTGR